MGLLTLLGFAPRWVRRLRAAKLPLDQPVTWIEVPELVARLRRDPRLLVVDVRGPDEFGGELGHIDGAMNLPLGELSTRIGDPTLRAASSLVLVCKTQMRSAQAAGLLTQSGFHDVAVLRGGMVEWVRQRPAR